MKFSIRDLFLVTVIVALAVGWWVDHRRQEAKLDKALHGIDPLYEGPPLKPLVGPYSIKPKGYLP